MEFSISTGFKTEESPKPLASQSCRISGCGHQVKPRAGRKKILFCKSHRYLQAQMSSLLLKGIAASKNRVVVITMTAAVA